MPRLRTVSPNSRGWSRRRAGKGFVYLDHTGAKLCAEDSTRPGGVSTSTTPSGGSSATG